MRDFVITDITIHNGKIDTCDIREGVYETAIYAAEYDCWDILELSVSPEEASACHKKWLNEINNMDKTDYLNFINSRFGLEEDE